MLIKHGSRRRRKLPSPEVGQHFLPGPEPESESESESIPGSRFPRDPGTSGTAASEEELRQLLQQLRRQSRNLQQQFQQLQQQSQDFQRLQQQSQNLQQQFDQLLRNLPANVRGQVARQMDAIIGRFDALAQIGAQQYDTLRMHQQALQNIITALQREPESPEPPQQPTVSTQQQIVNLLTALRETFSSEREYRGTTKDDVEQQLRTALEDAQVKDILSVIDAQAFVTKLIATDDNLAAYDPEDVFEAYTFLYSMAPSALQNEVVASAFIQKYLAQGKTIDPYDVRQLTAIEQGLRGKGSVAV